jgi:hypothetical protein
MRAHRHPSARLTWTSIAPLPSNARNIALHSAPREGQGLLQRHFELHAHSAAPSAPGQNYFKIGEGNRVLYVVGSSLLVAAGASIMSEGLDEQCYAECRWVEWMCLYAWRCATFGFNTRHCLMTIGVNPRTDCDACILPPTPQTTARAGTVSSPRTIFRRRRRASATAPSAPSYSSTRRPR